MRDREFWHQKWAKNEIGFHLLEVNELLIKYWSHTNPSRTDKVLVPLCGKSEDLVWLAQRHNSVQGIELSNVAVRAFFAEQLYTPTVTKIDAQHELYQFDELTIYAGDFFTVPFESVDIVYDRGALVALPPDMRIDYIDKIKQKLNQGARILLVTLDYPQTELAGPPFSVPEQEVTALFSGFKITQLNKDDADKDHPRIKKGLSRFSEVVWLITKV